MTTDDAAPLSPQFLAPNPYQDWHDPEPQHAGHEETPAHLRHPDDPEFRHLDGSPSQIPRPVDAAPERDEEAVHATPTAAPPRPDAPPQAPMAAGTYAVYDDNQGGYVLVIGTREGDTHHKHIPAKVVKMGEMMMGGNSPLAALFGG